MKCPDDRVLYSIICDTFPVPATYYGSYEAALRMAKIEQPMHRPHYIVKCTESYEICSVIDKRNRVVNMTGLNERDYE
jgi:hypothetical protein